MLWSCLQLPQLASEGHAGGAAHAPLERLAGWALQWSSHVHPSADAGGAPGVWLEIGASLALFGGLPALLARLRAALAPLGYTQRLGVAPTPAGAALLARAGIDAPVTDPTTLRTRLEPLPLALLALPEPVLAACDAAGMRCIGTLLAQEPAAIARRFGPAASDYLQRLVGLAPDPLPAWQPPPRWRARCEFASAVDATTALLFPLQRLLHELAGFLRATDRAVQRFALTLEHPAAPPLRLVIGLSIPGRDAGQFLRLARERLESVVARAPAGALTLEAEEFTTPATLQTDLFAPERNATTELAELLDRLNARLGDEAVRRLQPHADHRPERAWRYLAGESPPPRVAVAVDDGPPRPCWLLQQPERIAPPAELLAGPERIEAGWWDGADAARDYYLARDAAGARLWVFRDLRSADWYLAGLWA